MTNVVSLIPDEPEYADDFGMAAYEAAKAKYNAQNTDGLTWDDLSRKDKLPLYQAETNRLRTAAIRQRGQE
jgi:hypothetical protein